MSDPVDMTFVTLDVGGGTWLEWGSSITGVTDMVNQAIAKLGPGQCIRRLILCTHGSTGGGFLGFDATGSGLEIINGAQMDPTVKAQLQRLRPYFCPEGVIEVRCCLFAAGAKGKQAVQGVADAAGVPVTAPEDSIMAIMGTGGICADWTTAYPSNTGIPMTTSWWRGSGVEQTPAGPAAAAGAAAGAAAAGAAAPRFVPMPGLPSPAPPGPAVVSPEVRNALLFKNKPSPEAGYSELNKLGDALAYPPEPDTPHPFQYVAPDAPPPFKYVSPLQQLQTTGGSFDSTFTYQPLQPNPPSFVDNVRQGCASTVWRIGCAVLASVLALGGIGLYLLAPGLFGLGHSTHSSSPAGGTVASSPASAAGCSGPAKLIIDQFYPDLVLGGGGTAPTFSTGGKKYCLTHLATYHWNGGQGDPPMTKPNPSPAPSGGTLWLTSGGKVFGGGPWKATATPGTGGALVNWEVDIPISPTVIIDGTYTVEDSRPGTWSWSNASHHEGFIRVWGIAYTGP